MVRSAIAAKLGALFVSRTYTMNEFVALNGGDPLSVTRTVMLVMLGPCASVGVQVKTPLVGFTLAPVGNPGSKLNVRESPSGSIAVIVNVKRLPSFTVLFPIPVSTGGLLVPPPVTA